MRISSPVFIQALLAVFLLLLSVCAQAETRIGVLFPEASPALQKLYQTIISGMALAPDVRLASRAVGERDASADIKSWLVSNQIQVTVVLGSLPGGLAAALSPDFPLVHGASALNDNHLPGVSLSASPSRLFARLKLLKPDIERVYVIYKPQSTGWLVGLGKSAARDAGIELIALPSEDIQQSAALVQRIAQQARLGKDGVWLTLDPVVPANQLLPVLLREAWDKNLALFSNNPLDVGKGALFALYPDYREMGRQLADRARRQLAKPGLSGPEPSEHLLGALNTRTASHLGIQPGEAALQTFNQHYPER